MERVSATRPWVNAFADEMEAKLEQNRHKGDREGWSSDAPLELMRRLKEEARELEAALRWPRALPSDADKQRIREEAADVANFAMMIADVAGGMRPKP